MQYQGQEIDISIEIDFNPNMKCNYDSPYLWIVWGVIGSNSKCNLGTGWATQPEIAWRNAYAYVQGQLGFRTIPPSDVVYQKGVIIPRLQVAVEEPIQKVLQARKNKTGRHKWLYGFRAGHQSRVRKQSTGK